MATRLEVIRTMTAEQMAQVLIDSNYLDGLTTDHHFCKGDCDWAESMDDDGPDEQECLGCCVRWLSEEVEP